MYQPNHIANKLKLRVILDVRRSVGLIVATHIRGHYVVTSRDQGGQDVTPAIPEFRPTVHQHYYGPSPCSAMCILIPFTWVNRCLMLAFLSEIGDIAANVAAPPRESK